MNREETKRKIVDRDKFLEIRQTSEKVTKILDKRLKEHLSVIKALFFPKKLLGLGTYIQSSVIEDVLGADKAFAEIQEKYSAICENPFELPKKLKAPLSPISDQLEGTPFQYPVYLSKSQEKAVHVTSPAKWILSYRCDSSLNRLRDMVSGDELRQPDDMKQTLVNHLIMVVFLKHFPALTQLLKDLRYDIDIRELNDLGGLPVVILKSPVETFLPPDDFILEYTMVTGVPRFHEIVDMDALDNITDPLREALKAYQ